METSFNSACWINLIDWLQMVSPTDLLIPTNV